MSSSKDSEGHVVPTAGPKSGGASWQVSHRRKGWLFVAPALVLFALMVAYPIGRSFYLSFFDYSILEPDSARFVGMANYEKLFTQSPNRQPFWNTLYFTAVFTPPYVILALAIAMMLNACRRGTVVLRTLIFAPVVVSLAVSAVMWTLFYNPSFGMAQQMLQGAVEAINNPLAFVASAAAIWIVALALIGIYFCMVCLTRLWGGLPNVGRNLFVGSAVLEAMTVLGMLAFGEDWDQWQFLLVVIASGATALLGLMIWIAGIARSRWTIRRTIIGSALVSAMVVVGIWLLAAGWVLGIVRWVFGMAGMALPNFSVAAAPAAGMLGDSRWAMIAIAIMCVWNGVGINIILFLVGLQRIPDEIYEAGMVDGAGAWRRFIGITLPQLRPTIYLVVILSLIGAFKVFGQPFIMTEGGPEDSTLTFVMRMYNLAFKYGKFELGYASALAYALGLFILVFSLLMRRLNRPVE